MKVYHYSYSRVNSVSDAKSTHWSDLAAVRNGYPPVNRNDTTFGDILINYLMNFIKYDNPNGLSSYAKAPLWPEYGNNRAFINLDRTGITTGNNIGKDCDALNKILFNS